MLFKDTLCHPTDYKNTAKTLQNFVFKDTLNKFTLPSKITQELITGFNSLSPLLLRSSLHIKIKVAISANTQRSVSSTSAGLMTNQTLLLRQNNFGLLQTGKRKKNPELTRKFSLPAKTKGKTSKDSYKQRSSAKTNRGRFSVTSQT